MRSILLLILLLFAAPIVAQEQQQVNDSSKPFLTIVTHSDWAKRPLEKELVDAVTSQPSLGIAKQCHFNHYTTDSDMYKYRWASIYPEASLPAIVFQNPSGGYWYKASGQNVPRGSSNLFNEIEKHTKLVPQELQPQPQSNDDKRPRLPRRQPDQEETPDSAWVGGNAPIRETLSSGAMIMIGVVLLAGLLAISVIGIGFILAINKAFENK